jgi:putative ABC transport system substrate-binding protein
MASRNYTLQRVWTRQATIGFLGATNEKVWGPFLDTFNNRLHELGWILGHNLAVEQKWADGNIGQHAGFAQGFANSGVDVIVTSGTQAVLAAKRALRKAKKEGRNTPIVFASAGDPVRTKLVKTLKNPGGNVTGLSNGQTDLARRRLDEFRKMVPNLQRLAILGNLGSGVIPLEIDRLKKRARRLGIQTVVFDVRKSKDIGPAIKRMRGKVDGLYVCTDPFITTHQVAINTAAASARLPTMHAFREYVEAGGLMSYGPDFRAMFGKAADIVDKILRQTKPADIPVQVQKKHELVINPYTAQALGLRIPKGVRKRAKVIK